MKSVPLEGLVYQPVPGFEDHLQEELKFVSNIYPQFECIGPFYWFKNPGIQAFAIPPVFWNLNTWLNPARIEFESINEAAGALREIQRNWAPVHYPIQTRRADCVKAPENFTEKTAFPLAASRSFHGSVDSSGCPYHACLAALFQPFPGRRN